MMNVAVIVGLAFGLCRAGIIRSYGPDPMDACTVCATEEKGVLYCRGERVAAVISVEACPGGQLWTDGDILVTGLRGSVERVRLTRTTLACDMFPTSEAVLNGQKCVS